MLNVLSPTKVNALDELVDRIRAGHAAVLNAGRSAVEHAMDAGDALRKARLLVASRQWEQFCKRWCGISPRAARNYVALAEARPKLISAWHAEMTIQGALKLIGRKPGGSRKRRPAPVLTAASWKLASPEERQRFVVTVGMTELLAAFPDGAKNAEVQPFNNAHLTRIFDLFNKALDCAQAGIDSEAINALRAVHRVLASQGHDFHELIAALRFVASDKRGKRRAA